MAAAGEVITQDADLDDVKDPKKKRFFRLKNFKQLFVRKKRTKSKDDELKTKSLANVSDSLERDDATDEDAEGGRISGSLSMSHDSVFSPDKPRDGGIGELTKSMEALSGPGFKNELASKLGLRPPNFAGGESSSHGIRQRNTIAADVLVENDLRTRADKSYESDHSVMSMESSENEIEEDFFRDKWASNSSLSKRTSSPDPGFGSGDLDLNVITSTSGLNISAAKHKIAIKQKGKRASSHILARRHHTTSPKHPGMQTLPEESATTSEAARQDLTSEDEGPLSTASLESLGSSGKNSPLPIIEPIADYDEEPTPKPIPKASPRIAKKPAIISQKPSLPKASEQSETKTKTVSAGKVENKVQIQQRTAKGSTDNIQKATTPKEESTSSGPEFTKVVLKKTSSSDEQQAEKSPEKTTAKPSESMKPIETNKSTGGKEAKEVSGEVKWSLQSERNHVIMKAESKNEDETKRDLKTEQIKKELQSKSEQIKGETKSIVSQVIMRQKSTSGDSGKRQTIAVLSPTEEKDSSTSAVKRVSKRSSWIEQTAQDKDKEETDQKKDPPPKNEFAQMFSKFQRRASQKKDDPGDKKSSSTVLKAATSRNMADKSGTSPESLPGATSPQPVPSPKSGVSLSPVTSLPSSQTAVSKSPTRSPPIANTITSSSGSINSPTSPGVSASTPGESKPSNSSVVGKSVSVQPAAQDSSKAKTVVIEKPKAQQETTTGTKVTSSPEKKTVDFFQKKVVIEETSKPAVSFSSDKDSSSTSTESKTKSIVITKQQVPATANKAEEKKENDENAQPKSDTKPSQTGFRRSSPMQKDRVRSQTLPEQPVLTQKVANQNTGSEKESSSPTPQRSKSMKPTTTAPTEETPSDGRPSWVAMAKRKTGGWSKDTTPPKEQEQENIGETTNVDKNEEAPAVSAEIGSKKSIKDLMSKFQ